MIEAVAILAHRHATIAQLIQRSLRGRRQGMWLQVLSLLALLIEHRVDDVHERFVAALRKPGRPVGR